MGQQGHVRTPTPRADPALTRRSCCPVAARGTGDTAVLMGTAAPGAGPGPGLPAPQPPALAPRRQNKAQQEAFVGRQRGNTLLSLLISL